MIVRSIIISCKLYIKSFCSSSFSLSLSLFTMSESLTLMENVYLRRTRYQSFINVHRQSSLSLFHFFPSFFALSFAPAIARQGRTSTDNERTQQTILFQCQTLFLSGEGNLLYTHRIFNM